MKEKYSLYPPIERFTCNASKSHTKNRTNVNTYKDGEHKQPYNLGSE